jgi:membrane protein implicated in regulation of membrane protease activity
MEWNQPTLWWLAAGVLVAAELATGTFYLLMLALGCAAGAVAAHAGLGIAAQVVVAAVLGGGGTAGWHFKRARQPRSAPSDRNADMSLDIGQAVQVAHWDEDQTTHVRYRGAAWRARWAGPGQPAPGACVIVAIQGNELRLAPAATP